MAMISHVYIGVNDFEQALTFYSPLMQALGFVLKFREPDYPRAGWMEPGVPRPLFLVGRPWDGKAAQSGNGQMVALLAPSRAAVDAAYAAALAHGGADEGAPGLRPHYHPNYYGAYFRDPEGNKLCVCCHDPADH
ncbi:catechol 2,3-dioxygenase-like lactoylglutathione lyase family enzyme [Paraburkholderia silvatlantica]|uniref:Catechol 2,3-dioxygenase-like lactoylglutathione lyase family enzyme n=2 Tax=Paraburkholderia silvatlantica TaxID=321895 RepID=A0A2V4T9T4_9BURK|nr:catechol 2,3-dioxygenase-like lactoylglutathione lyase family enzyme [Paraburkholderia silvatlantica]TDQ75525.1 catechol 2,3-dioxygenase-like lactoylglutathione lyase family enzyme [Paraburkholderia silvatlantica]